MTLTMEQYWAHQDKQDANRAEHLRIRATDWKPEVERLLAVFMADPSDAASWRELDRAAMCLHYGELENKEATK